MSDYTSKEIKIVNQCHNGPFYTLITKLTNDEFDRLSSKLIKDDDHYALVYLVSIYCDYNRNKIIDYFIDKGDVDLLLGFLDYCYDFTGYKNELDQKYIIDGILEKNDKDFVNEILESNFLYFLTDKREKQRLIDFVKE